MWCWNIVRIFSNISLHSFNQANGTGSLLGIKNLHLCSTSWKKKEKFHNIYIQEYRPKIYTGFIEDHFTKIHKKNFYNIEDDAPDFEKSLLK